jgi:hypothetical protein
LLPYVARGAGIGARARACVAGGDGRTAARDRGCEGELEDGSQGDYGLMRCGSYAGALKMAPSDARTDAFSADESSRKAYTE